MLFFSTFNRGYIPKCVTSSFEKFLELNHYLEKLPKTSESIFKKEDENESGFQDWKNYAALGFFAYDNQDAHRIEKLYQYDIIYKPVFPIKIESTIRNSFQEIIPAFDLIFGEDVKFEILEKSLKTKPDRF